MIRNNPVMIDIWQGDWGLPSVDLTCLRLMTYAKFAGLELNVKKLNNPFRTPSGTLPVLRIGSKVIQTYEELSNHVKSKNIDPDEGLTPKQRAEVIAYTNLLAEHIYPALQYMWWIDEKNYNAVTRPMYCKMIPFPFNFYYPNRYLNKAKQLLDAVYGHITNPKDMETKLYSDAEKCLTALSVRLGDSKYMFGDHPSSIDATMYAYLAPLAKTPLPNSTLQNHLKGCSNLFKYVNRISQIYFNKETKEYETKLQEETKKRSQNNETDFPNKRRNQVFAVLFALVAMAGYALSSGIVENSAISYEEDEEIADPPEYSPLE